MTSQRGSRSSTSLILSLLGIGCFVLSVGWLLLPLVGLDISLTPGVLLSVAGLILGIIGIVKRTPGRAGETLAAVTAIVLCVIIPIVWTVGMVAASIICRNGC